MPGSASRAPLTVLVTIHGIGFQVSPADTDRGPDPSGYADALHAHLTDVLGSRLSPDPGRTDPDTGQPFGPVYVQSQWPPSGDDYEAGLARLDPNQPLRTGNQPFAHVALVYSHLQDVKPSRGSLLALCFQALVKHRNYAPLPRIARWLWTDAAAFRKPPVVGPAVGQSPSLEVRPRPGRPKSALRRVPVVSPQRGAGTVAGGGSSAGPPDSLWGTLRALEYDFAAYVLRNDLRERVRGFVEDAIVRLATRDEVDGIVINAHSQGTAAAFDVLTELADQPATKIRHLITSGSHLRKLVDLFDWGNATGDLSPALEWTNFYDSCDPVADALGPDQWMPGEHLKPQSESGPTLFANRPVKDVEVCNVKHTPGTGLRAHNYFDNIDEWIPTVTQILTEAAETQRVATPTVDVSQFFDTTVAERRLGSAIRFISVPARAVTAPDTLLDPQSVMHVLGFESVQMLNSADELSSALAKMVNSGVVEGADPTEAADFTAYCLSKPLIPFEQSPLELTSLTGLLTAPAMGIGAFVGYVAGGGTPLIIVTVPAGMVICGAAAAVAKGLETGLQYRLLKFLGVPQAQDRVVRAPTKRGGGGQRR